MRLINVNIGVAAIVIVVAVAVAVHLPIINAATSSHRELSDLSSAGKQSESTVLQRINTMATYEEVKDVPNHPDIYLIDVRNPEELTETGSIPASLNIPLPNLEAALKAEPEEFEKTYGRAKPAKDAKIIFTCRSGKRAQEAEQIAKAAEYTNLSVYHGSWLEWAEKEAQAQ